MMVRPTGALSPSAQNVYLIYRLGSVFVGILSWVSRHSIYGVRGFMRSQVCFGRPSPLQESAARHAVSYLWPTAVALASFIMNAVSMEIREGSS